MKPPDIIQTSFEALAVNKIRSSLTMLGVTIGVAAVILLMALGHGTKASITRQVTELGANLLIIQPAMTAMSDGFTPSLTTTRKLTYEDVAALKRRVPLLDEVVPTIGGSARIRHMNRSRHVRVVGVTPGFLRMYHLSLESGSFLTNQDVEARRHVVVLGAKVKRELFGEETSLGQVVTLADVRHRFIGMTKPKGVLMGYDFDDRVFVPVTTAQVLFGITHLRDIRVSVETPALIDQASDQIKALLYKRHGKREDFYIIKQGAVLSTLATIIDLLTGLLAGLGGVSLMVGGIGIMNIMLVSVMERTREIGLRKALGARKRDILLQFLAEAVVLSITGGIIGIIVGVIGAWLLPYVVPNASAEVRPWAILLSFASAILLGIFWGTYPARKASLLDPIEALRRV